MRLIGKTGELKVGDLVGDSPLGKLVSIIEPNEENPKGLLKILWAGSEPPTDVQPSIIGAHFKDD